LIDHQLNRSMKRLMSTDAEDLNPKKRMDTRNSYKVQNDTNININEFNLSIIDKSIFNRISKPLVNNILNGSF
jgi:hypothetical protein